MEGAYKMPKAGRFVDVRLPQCQAVLQAVQEARAAGICRAGVEKSCRLTHATAISYLRALANAGHITHVGQTYGARWVVPEYAAEAAELVRREQLAKYLENESRKSKAKRLRRSSAAKARQVSAVLASAARVPRSIFEMGAV